ncbi:MAG: cation diffusion facilitator family transporter [Candidatus Freyarchaeota archaeon]
MPSDAHREMRLVALSSVAAAILLVTLKLVVGWFSRSLGILSEAAHSGLDLLAAGITFFAVRAAVKPADVDHHYGHGKIENLAALVETLLLFVTCGWIVYEAVNRLFFTKVTVEASVWTFLVMIISIVVDFMRSRALYRVARKYNSQALEADALHFRTDIWSSSVVIIGLVLVWISENTGINPLLSQLKYVSPEFFVLSEYFTFDALHYADSVGNRGEGEEGRLRNGGSGGLSEGEGAPLGSPLLRGHKHFGKPGGFSEKGSRRLSRG